MDTYLNRRPSGRAGSALTPALLNYIHSIAGNWHPTTIYSTCPECSKERRKKRARCLSTTVQNDRAVFCCHHCEARGVVFRDGGSRLSRAEQADRQKIADAELRRDIERRSARARQVWNATILATGTPVERYLWHRGFDLAEIPPTLRYARLRHPGTGEQYDVMVAAVGYGPVPDAVHRTFLAPNGNGKASLPDDFDAKLSLGPIRGRPIRLDATSDAEAAAGSLAIAEGIENALVSVQEFGVPAWSAISAGNMPLLRLPPSVSLITVMADHDPVGLLKAREAAMVWLDAGRTVRLALPPEPGVDFNDMLRMRGRKESA